MKIIVTGCAGWLGSHLTAALSEAGHDVIGVDVIETQRAGDTVRDLCLEGALNDLLQGVETICHCAAIHPWKPYTDNQYMDNNIKPVWHGLNSAVACDVKRFVYCSSIAAIGYTYDISEMPLSEFVAPRPPDIYSATKWFGEIYCQQFARNTKLETVCIRPPAFMPKPLLEMGQGLLGNWGHVSDIVSAHVAAVSAPMPSRYEPFWAVMKMPYSMDDAEELRTNPAAVVERYYPGVPAWFAERNMGIPTVSMLYDMSRSKNILGWEPKYTFETWWEDHHNEL